MRKPILNGLFQNDVDGGDGTNYITNLAGIQIINRVTRDIYLGKRTNNVAGTGDKDSPYAANNKDQTNALLANPNTWNQGNVVCLMEDEFLHTGSNEWNIPIGGNLHGSGIGKTIMKLDPSTYLPAYGVNVVSSLSSASPYVSDMTIDCNYAALTNPNNGKVNGGFLQGPGSTFENVRVTGSAGLIAYFQEAFGLLVEATTGGRILDCFADGFLGDYGGGLVVAGPGGSVCTGGLIRNPQVNGYRPVGGSQINKHVAAVGCLGGEIIGGLLTGCQVGIYVEDCGKLSIRGVKILDCYEIGIHINASAGSGIVQDPQIIGNVIELRSDADTYALGIVLSEDNAGKEIHNASVIGNHIHLIDHGGPIAGRAGIVTVNAATNRGHKFIGNTVDADLDNTNIVGDNYCLANLDETGAVIPQIPDTLGILVSDDAFGPSWDGITNYAASKNSLYDKISTLETKVLLTPTIIGWYTVATGSSFIGGTCRIKGVASNGLSDVAFEFDTSGYGATGTFQQLRSNQNDANKVVDQVRLSNTDGGDGAPVQLDIHVGYITDLQGPIELYFYGPTIGTIVEEPVVGATVLDAGLTEFTFTKGFDSSYAPSLSAVYVDANYGSDVTGQRLIQALPKQTIQGAVDDAVDGDEIIVGPGIYDEEVTVKAGTYVITLQHGAIWKQTSDAACLKSANVTCDFTVQGDLYTEDDGATCVAMVTPCSNCIIRVKGNLYPTGTGTTYTVPCGAFHDDGGLYIEGDIVPGTGQIGVFSATPAATAVFEMRHGSIITGNHAAVTLLGSGVASFIDCYLSANGVDTISTDDRDMEFTRCTMEATGSNSVFASSGTAIMTLHEFNHLLSGSSATELSVGPLASIAMDGISFTNKPMEGGTSLTGKGYLVVEDGPKTGVMTLS